MLKNKNVQDFNFRITSSKMIPSRLNQISFVITMDRIEDKELESNNNNGSGSGTSCFFEESLSNLPSKTKDKIKFSILNKEEISLKKEKKDENQIVISSEEISTKKIQIVKIEIPTNEKKEKMNFISNSLLCYYQLWKTKLSLMIVVTTIGAYFSISQKLDSTSLWLSLGKRNSILNFKF